MNTESYLQPRSPSQGRLDAPPVLALGGGITLAAVLNILHRNGLPYYALCPPGDFARHSRWYRPLPTPLAAPGPADLEPLLDMLELDTAFLLPCSDDWLRAVAQLPARFMGRFLSSTPWSCVDLLTDKWRFAETLRRLGVPHPQTHLISSREQGCDLPDACFEGAILKPLSSVTFASRYGVKGYVVRNRSEAEAVLSGVELPIMLQQFVPGPPAGGYFLDGYRDRNGRIAALFARRRLRMHPAPLGNSTLVESVPLRCLHGAIFPLEFLLEQIAYRGIFSAEFKYDARDRQFKLIEINARPWWYVEFAAMCGVDVCRLAYLDATGQPVPEIQLYPAGRRAGLPLHDLRAWKTAGNHYAGLFSVLKTWARAQSTPFHANDPLPGLCYLFNSARSVPSGQAPTEHRALAEASESNGRLTAAAK